jgi:molybdopterin-guanine dinucleotide biosynthesis protein A
MAAAPATMAATRQGIVRVVGVVLAGGGARRFGSDKLAASLDGRPLLRHAVDGLGAVCDEVIVSLAAGGRVPPWLNDADVPIRAVHDATSSGGPIAGLRAALAVVDPAAIVVVAGGDMPRLEVGVLRLLVDALGEARAGEVSPAAAVLGPDGTSRPLPFAVRADAATTALAVAGDSIRGLIAAAGPIRVIPDARWRAIDPHGATRWDIDRPEDLDRIRGATGRT